MKNYVSFLLILFMVSSLRAQNVYFTRNAEIQFFSSTPMENIEAICNSATSVIDVQKAKVEFSATLKSFVFEKALMQEHFNENYVESHKYPKAVFKGDLIGAEKISWSEPGEHKLQVEGDFSLHGVTRKVKAEIEFIIHKEGINAVSKFNVKPEDYAISIPDLVRDKIAKTIEVSVKANYKPFKR
jgi:polyisoprenoid-binding protein YceI